MPNSKPTPKAEPENMVEAEKPVTTTQVTTPPRKKGHLPVRMALISLLGVGLVAIAGYVWLEYQTLSKLASLHQQTLTAEMDKGQEVQELLQSFDEDTEEASESEDEDTEAAPADLDARAKSLLEQVDEQLDQSRLVEDQLLVYRQLLVDNQAAFRDLAGSAQLLMGPNKKLVTDFVDNQVAYYDQELADVDDSLTLMDFSQNSFNFQRSNILLGTFMAKTGSLDNESAVRDAFPSLSQLEQYTREDFEYEGAEAIRETHSLAYEALEKQKQYFSTTYSAIKDLVAGDEKSAAYKFSRLGDDVADLASIDADRIFDQNKEEIQAIKRGLVEKLAARQALLPSLANYQFGSLATAEDLAVCHLFRYKIDFVRYSRDKSPAYDSLDALLADLDQLSPDLSQYEDHAREVMELTADDETVTLTCKTAEKEYTFEFNLPEEDEE